MLLEYKIGICDGKTCHPDNATQKKKSNIKNRITKPRKNRNAWEKKETYKSWEYWKWTPSNNRR